MSLNIMLLLAMALFYNMMATLFGVEHWYFLALAPLAISAIGFLALSGDYRINQLSLAFVPLFAVPLMLPAFSLNEILGFVFSHAVIMAIILYPTYDAVRRTMSRKSVLTSR